MRAGTILRGSNMPFDKINEFCFIDWDEIEGGGSEGAGAENAAGGNKGAGVENAAGGNKDAGAGTGLASAQKYKKITDWALKARGRNPGAFDMLTEWILDDAEWGDERLAENEQTLMQGVFARFKGQNARLRAYLKELEPSGVVNPPVFDALDRFDDELSGHPRDERLRSTVENVFADFSSMRERAVRKVVAGDKTGLSGTDSVDFFGYVNYLKDCDAQVQWILFMPDAVKEQQKGFKVESFEYRKLPAMRFIGRELLESDGPDARAKTFGTLNELAAQESGAYMSGFDYDLLFMHHYGRGVDIEHWHGFWGRFMQAGAPVPEGFVSFDFEPDCEYKAGLPFRPSFAYAVFTGDDEALHKREGYDSDAMYDVTRNIILGQGVLIPYPEKYWTAEAFLNGYENYSTAYLFSADF